MRSAETGKPLTAAETRSLFYAFEGLESLLLAVSGGPDSTALLLLAARWRAAMKKGPKLFAATVDHGLRPDSAKEARQVAQLARRLGVPHRTLRWTGRKPNTGLQQAARIARYRLLSAEALKLKAHHIVTAHTLDDQAETVLMRLARGSGLTGLAGMDIFGSVPVKEGRGLGLFRPLIGIPKGRLIATLKAAKIPYATDSSNDDPRFTRVRWRAVMPALAREGLSADRVALFAQRVQRAEDALFYIVNEVQARLCPRTLLDSGPPRLSAQEFLELPAEIGLRLLGRLIDSVGDEGPAELRKLEAMYDALWKAAEAVVYGFKASFRRTLAGALVKLEGREKAAAIVIERAPARRGKKARNRDKRPEFFVLTNVENAPETPS